MKDNFYILQAELIKMQSKCSRLGDKYKEFKDIFIDIFHFIEEKRFNIEEVKNEYQEL